MAKKGNVDFYRDFVDRLVPSDTMTAIGKLVVVFQMLDGTVRLIAAKLLEMPRSYEDPRVPIAVIGDRSFAEAVKLMGSLYQVRLESNGLKPIPEFKRILKRLQEAAEVRNRVVKSDPLPMPPLDMRGSRNRPRPKAEGGVKWENVNLDANSIENNVESLYEIRAELAEFWYEEAGRFGLHGEDAW